MSLQPVWTDFVSGSLSFDIPSATAGTSQTMTSPGLTTLGAVANGTQFAKITLDPFAQNGLPELVYVTSHSANANTATIQRQSGQPLRDHPPSETWVHGPTAEDFTAIYGLLNTFTFSMTQTTFTGGPTSGSTELTLGSLAIAGQISAYQLECSAYMTCVADTAGDIFTFRIKVGGVEVASVNGRANGAGANQRIPFALPTCAIQSISANSAQTVTTTLQRVSGSGTGITDGGSHGTLTARMSFFV